MFWAPLLLCFALAAPALSLGLGNHRPRLLKGRKPHYRRDGLNGTKGPTVQYPASPFFNQISGKFAVDGASLPLLDFDVGESYAGLLPIGNDLSRNLYFWFFPSTNPVAHKNKEILIYLTGGPGCSSIGELLQSNGPLLWQPGIAQPIQNKWSWHRLTNVVWVEQPIGTGFSQGARTAANEDDVAAQFLPWWKNFVETFMLQGYTVYVTGSSYGGMYAPFIASAMLDQNDKHYFNVSGMAVWDGLYSKIPLVEDIPVAAFVEKWKSVLPFNDTFTGTIAAMDEECGYSAYLDEFLVFPPSGVQPSMLPGEDPITGFAKPECALYISVFLATQELNPCLSAFDVTSRCPILFDPIGFSAGTFTLPSTFPTPYFNLPEVKSALHAPPNTTWVYCQDPTTSPVFAGGIDTSLVSGPGSQPVLPRVIDATRNVILGHGSRDFLLLPDATLLTIQNLTWQGELGFQRRPEGALFIPNHDNADVTTAAGGGVVGSSHSERGLTWFGAALAGHLVGMDQPAVVFRMVEVLLGRVEGFESQEGFTVDMGLGPWEVTALGKGTVEVVEGSGATRDLDDDGEDGEEEEDKGEEEDMGEEKGTGEKGEGEGEDQGGKKSER